MKYLSALVLIVLSGCSPAYAERVLEGVDPGAVVLRAPVPAKSAERKAYENAFFARTEELLALLSDPRAGQAPPVKLGFVEIDALIGSIPEAQTLDAMRLALKLLSIDAALKRFDPLWWDSAETHPEGEE